jgi:O-antigen/teichoic acid export membrane protein
VRVGTAETTFGAARISSEDWRGAAALFRFGYGIDALTGVLGFLVVASMAPFVGPFLLGHGGTQLVLLFGLTLLVSTVDESSATALRLMGRFRLLAFYMSGLEAIRVAAIGVALLIDRSLTAVLVALVVYDLAGAATNWLVANHVFSRASGRSLIGRASEPFTERRAMLRMIFHTNVVSYARIAQVQLPTLLLGALTSTSQVGLYKVGSAAGAIVGRVADPVYAAVLPRLSRLWAAQKRDELLRLIRDATPVSAGIAAATLSLLLGFHSSVLRLIGGSEASAAVYVLVFVGTGYAVSGMLFWNTSLLFATGRSGIVSLTALLSAFLQVSLLVPLTFAFEASGAALALCASLIVSNLVAAAFGLRELRAPPTGGGQSVSRTADQRATAT